MEITFQLEEIESVAQKILTFNLQKIVLFEGLMGVGKTTLIAQICKALGVNDSTSSPTFSIVNEYISNRGETIFHFDFYRLKSETEALDMGIEDYLYSNNWCFIEWSDKIASLIPENHTVITIKTLDQTKRILNIQ
ncbi:tRNA (adenosine(37)-N6)-threonylcarbamoyltransferase complex ATPase subunit type 1 TsaE [Flavobacterium branchiophilum]|uniref:tRNA threonylcarbamoyladenosine biosynthesis protein TsaE n=1 Tax=Flavobacterium branchiophilum TaxID=55197 RepID=A0A2H3KYJ9_9FLAO|nr:tRNA (adenosine(37)-N6)-threonylcarbamoyltransferase complex ATPase subunit type 1 TsaE [Flavobacterium branchiophilum]PDS24790.1 tRNA (adenosine(37)-N6)-threonylcarbamoyltransferase complex ATPase subunit type 1 TsaE [Flavobacterium branchiophilum]